MKLYRSLDEVLFQTETVFTMGTFDGVHLGHRKIIEDVHQLAEKCKCRSLVFTFESHPSKVLGNRNPGFSILTSAEEKIDLLSQTGIDGLIIVPFTKEFSGLDAEMFVREMIVRKIGLTHFVLGYDHHFGQGGKGNKDMLDRLCEGLNFEIHIVNAVKLNGEAVSSTKIRELLKKGDIHKANQLLGSRYQLRGDVIHGKKIGQTLGFPTANLKLHEPDKLIPKSGVYAVNVYLKSKRYHGTLNIGFSKDQNQDIEVHIHEFSDNIYQEIVTLELIDFIREEKSFDSLGILKKQIQKDIKQSIQRLNTEKSL